LTSPPIIELGHWRFDLSSGREGYRARLQFGRKDTAGRPDVKPSVVPIRPIER